MPEPYETPVLLSGRYFTAQEIEEIKETVRMFPRLSRYELAKTLCENLDWFTPSGQYKLDSCKQLLNKLEEQGLITLPTKQEQKVHDTKDRISFSSLTDAGLQVEGVISDFESIFLEPVLDRAGIRLWNEYLHRYHPLGYKRPFGAHQRYFIVSEVLQKPMGCLLFAAAAWSLQPRDEWIGWTAEDRSLRLNFIVNNTRLLIFPWVHVKNLASKALSLATKRVLGDWQERYGYSPVLLETFVDPEKYRGTCYQAANWIFLGQTKGRGRTELHNKTPFTRKHIYVYPLRPDFRAVLRGESGVAK